jgi:hypothetical protein
VQDLTVVSLWLGFEKEKQSEKTATFIGLDGF